MPDPSIDLPLAEVHLWLTDMGADAISDVLLARYRALLSSAEEAQSRRFVFDKDRCRYLVTRALVRTVLSRYAPERAPRDWLFDTNPQGCPRIANQPEVTDPFVFNISHTDAVVALAVRRRHAVGIDVEKWSRDVNLDIARHFFSAREVTDLVALPEPLQRTRFLELWTLKESYIKARQMGLSIPLDHFGFELAADRHIGMFCAPELDDSAQRWWLAQLHWKSAHVLAVCAERAEGQAPRLVSRQVLPLSGEGVLFDWPITRESTH